MDGVETFGRHPGEAKTLRDTGIGSEMEARDRRRIIMRQCEIEERNKDQSRFLGFF
jgi:hypothetical protein